MDYTNLNRQHQLQEQANKIGQSNSSLQKIPSSSSNHSWNPSIRILNDGADLNSSETFAYSRLLPCLAANNFMTSQDLGSYSFDQARSFMNCQLPADGSPLQNIKEETSDSFSKLRINLPFEGNKSNRLSTLYKQDNHVIEALHSNSIAQAYSTSFGAGFTSFSHVIPNISFGTAYRAGSDSSSPSFLLASHELGFNKSKPLDLLSSPRTNAYRGAQSSSPSTQHSSSDGFYRECNMSLRHGHHMQDSTSSPSSISNMKSGFFTEAKTTRTKRRPASNLSEPKDQSHNNAEAKKSKSTSRSSNPPLKVRKEKLGDRISALHRLVAPFGKTDTASVLTEAIGYIQFLHDQVQTLSMPYMKSLQSKPSRKTQQVHGFGKDAETELKILDLRSRGLCLVPISCASYLNGFD